MSEAKNTDPLKELDLDLEFLPAWAQKPNDAKPYADYAGGVADHPSRRVRASGTSLRRRNRHTVLLHSVSAPKQGETPDPDPSADQCFWPHSLRMDIRDIGLVAADDR